MSDIEETLTNALASLRYVGSPHTSIISQALVEIQRLQAAEKVADTLVARRDVEREIGSHKLRGLPTNTPYWHGLMVRERDARVENDGALAKYREAKSR